MLCHSKLFCIKISQEYSNLGDQVKFISIEKIITIQVKYRDLELASEVIFRFTLKQAIFMFIP